MGKEHSTTKQATLHPTTRDLHWAAGLLEGEGHFRANTSGSGQATALMTDREPIEKLLALLGGSFTIVDRKPWKRQYLWSTSGARARGVMMTLYPLLSPRRQQQIKEALGVRFY